MEATETKAKKLLPVYILEVLKKYSDAEHVLTQEEIARKIEEEYGLKIERKAIGRNIKLLCDANYDVETKSGKGFYFGERFFDDSELRVLIDGVRYCRYLRKRDSDSLCEKLKGLGTVGFRERTKYIKNVTPDSNGKTKEIFYTIDLLQHAMSKNKKVTFDYYEYGINGELQPVWGEKLIVSPVEMIISNGNYYLIGLIEGNDAFTNFRLEKIRDVTKTNLKIDKTPKFDLKEYLSAHPLMYCGEPITATIKVDDILLDETRDYFGEDIPVLRKSDGEGLGWTELTVRADKGTIMEFALKNLGLCELLAPDYLRQKLKRNLQNALEVYSTSEE